MRDAVVRKNDLDPVGFLQRFRYFFQLFIIKNHFHFLCGLRCFHRLRHQAGHEVAAFGEIGNPLVGCEHYAIILMVD
ncbi:hypothetical protein D3C87_1799170 [compost metagenome]